MSRHFKNEIEFENRENVFLSVVYFNSVEGASFSVTVLGGRFKFIQIFARCRFLFWTINR